MGSLVGKEAVGARGGAGRALKAGDQVWAPLGQEGAHLGLDGLEMKGASPPPLKQDVLEGTRARPGWSSVSPLLSDLRELPPPTWPHSLKLSGRGFVPREKVHIIQGPRAYGSAEPFQALSLTPRPTKSHTGVQIAYHLMGTLPGMGRGCMLIISALRKLR